MKTVKTVRLLPWHSIYIYKRFLQCRISYKFISWTPLYVYTQPRPYIGTTSHDTIRFLINQIRDRFIYKCALLHNIYIVRYWQLIKQKIVCDCMWVHTKTFTAILILYDIVISYWVNLPITYSKYYHIMMLSMCLQLIQFAT